MKNTIFVFTVSIAVLAMIFAGCPTDGSLTDSTDDQPLEVIDDPVVGDLNLTGLITTPSPKWTPDDTVIETDQYTAAVEWQDMDGDPVNGAFQDGIQYKAVISITVKPGYTLDGLNSGSFTVDGADIEFDAAAGVLTIVYPALSIPVLADDPSGKRVYFLAPNGNDSTGDGTMEKPWFTFKKVQTVVRPGDTVYLRGGTYLITNANSDNPVVSTCQFAIQLTVSGTSDNPITYTAYPKDETRPVFDFTGFTAGSTGGGTSNTRTGGILVAGGTTGGTNIRYIHLYGFDVTGIDDYTGSSGANGYGIYLYNSSYNTLENLRTYHNGGTGIYLPSNNTCTYNLIKNCDSYDNHSTRNSAMNGNNDGFGMHTTAASTGNVLYGCRAWANTDDGYDCINASAQVIYDHCWAGYNGYFYTHTGGNPPTDEYKRTNLRSSDLTRAQDGNGFKNGGWGMGNGVAGSTPATAPKMVVRYSVAIGNPHAGLQNNYQLNGGRWFYNTAHNNSSDINMITRWNETDMGGYFQMNAYDTVMKGNVVVPRANGTSGGVQYLDVDSGIVQDNSFILVDNGSVASHGRNSRSTSTYPHPPEYNSNHIRGDIVQNPLGLTSGHFISINEQLFLVPRNPDGSMPPTDFLRPKPGSPAAHIGYTAPDTNADGFGDAWKKAGAKPLIQP